MLWIIHVNPCFWLFRIFLAKESINFLPKHKIHSGTAMITFSMSLYERLANSNTTFQNEEINLFPDNSNSLAWEEKIIAFEGRFHSTWCFRAFVLFCLNHIFIKSKRIVWSLIIISWSQIRKVLGFLFSTIIYLGRKTGVKNAYWTDSQPD